MKNKSEMLQTGEESLMQLLCKLGGRCEVHSRIHQSGSNGPDLTGLAPPGVQEGLLPGKYRRISPILHRFTFPPNEEVRCLRWPSNNRPFCPVINLQCHPLLLGCISTPVGLLPTQAVYYICTIRQNIIDVYYIYSRTRNSHFCPNKTAVRCAERLVPSRYLFLTL